MFEPKPSRILVEPKPENVWASRAEPEKFWRVTLTHQNLIGHISAISKPIQFWFSPKLYAVQGLHS